MDTDNINPQSFMGSNLNKSEQSYGMGKKLYNNAMDKLIDAKIRQGSDRNGIDSKVNEECNEIFRQSIPYLKNAIQYYDGLKDQENSDNRIRLFQSLNALGVAYYHLGMYEELKPIKTRIEEYQ